MIAPRWRKVLRDTFGQRGRSLLAVLAMAAGVFEITTMVHEYALLEPALHGMYARTRPASATLLVDRVSDALVDSVRCMPGVGDAEARPVIVARVRVGPDEWVPARLQVVRDFGAQRLDTFEPDHGAWPPGPDDVLLERTALRVAKVGIGATLALRIEGTADRSVRVAGTVHAAGLPPAWMEHMVPGFVAWNSSLREGGVESAQIRMVVADHPLEEGHIREVADSVRTRLERLGHTVTRVTVPPPGRHPHADQMEAFLFLLLAFGILSFALSAVLVASMMHALMAEQVRQVGMMKAIGATDRQVAGLYLGQIALLAAGALIVGVPPGLLAGRTFAVFAAGVLNTDVSGAPFPLWGVAVVAFIGFVVPPLVALGPVRRAARIPVREALADDPPAPRLGGRRMRGLEGLAWLPRPLRLTLRATFSRRLRLALTVGMLAVGGATFMSALNVSSAWLRAVNDDFGRRHYDLAVGLDQPQPVAAVAAALAAVPEVERAEYWPAASPYLVGPGGVATRTVSLVGPDPGSRLLDLALARGRWLAPGDRHTAVVNGAVLALDPDLAVGDSVRVRLRGRTEAFQIVGIARELTPMASVYAPRADVLAATGQHDDEARSLRIVTRAHDDAGERAAARALEREFERRELPVTGLMRMRDARQGILDHLVIIWSVLAAAALVVVVVGGLGLTSMLTLGVVQRTREIGILAAIGATPTAIARDVWIEALVIGALSWVVAVALAAPLSWGLETACGNIFFKTGLGFHVSPLATGGWLALVLVLASISSFLPARRAARLTVREALSHA
ncbi:MAG: FtsX-like permease family protein [Candidatus Eisenbacteria bacterium]|uniref:FtsX-like permease family protein n=1 Tax=Eiseniibacteriota bacterium TaxID=2212470 RepID=A0A538UC90_UNCEI|nr:MAG: FtsX-like permease family protein [Candidatus Eisenbacteria bacterium]